MLHISAAFCVSSSFLLRSVRATILFSAAESGGWCVLIEGEREGRERERERERERGRLPYGDDDVVVIGLVLQKTSRIS